MVFDRFLLKTPSSINNLKVYFVDQIKFFVNFSFVCKISQIVQIQIMFIQLNFSNTTLTSYRNVENTSQLDYKYVCEKKSTKSVNKINKNC